MANFPKMTLTNAGIALQTKVQAGSVLAFKRLAMGDGQLNGSPVSPLTALVSEKASVTATSGKVMGTDTYQIGGLFVNTSITAGFWWREIGVYATDPTDSTKEILYCYANAGDAGDYIPPSADQRIEKHIYASMAVANASSVTITIPSSDSYVLASEKGEAGGVASLDSTGKVPSGQLPSMSFEAPIKDAAAKDTPVDADSVVLVDSADGSKTKRLLWSGVKATLKSYFDMLYAALGHTHAWGTITDKPSSFAPSAHAATHKTGGADAITPADIDAAAASHTHAEYDKTVKATYPVAAGSTIAAGDVVDVVGGVVTKAGTPSQAIALTTAAAGQPCEVIYSGVASLPGITDGQKIASDGVYGVGVLDGVLQVWSKDRPGQVVTGSYVGTGVYGADFPNSITFLSAIKLIIITAPATATNSKYANILIADNTVRLFGAYGGMGITTTTYTVLNGGNTLQWYANMDTNQFNESGLSYEYIALV